jgi:hypothetical protein
MRRLWRFLVEISQGRCEVEKKKYSKQNYEPSDEGPFIGRRSRPSDANSHSESGLL